MSNFHFKEKGMSLKAKGLLSLMLSLPDDWNYSISGLVKLSKDGKDSVMSALTELEKFGYLTRLRTINNKGQFSGVEYHIFEEPQAEIPVAEKTNSDKPISVKSHTEKPRQLNTNKLNTKELITNELNTNSNLEQYEEILSGITNKDLKNLYVDYIEMRRLIKSPLTPRALSMLITRVDRIAPLDLDLQKQLLEDAILNNWKSVYMPNIEKPKKQKQSNDFMNKLQEMYDKEN